MVGKTCRYIKGRQVCHTESIRCLAHTCYQSRIINSRRNIREKRTHFFFRFDVKIISRHAHPVFVGYMLACLHAKKDVMCLGIFLTHIMAVICSSQRNSRLLRNTDEVLIDPGLCRNRISLNFQVIISPAEHTVIPESRLFCLFKLVFHHSLGDFPCKAGRKCNESFAVFFKKFPVNARAIIESLCKSG